MDRFVAGTSIKFHKTTDFGQSFKKNLPYLRTAFRIVDDIMSDVDEVSQDMSSQSNFDHEYLVNRADDTKLGVKKAFDMYSQVTKSVLKWCNTAVPLLETYYKQIIDNNYDAKAQAQSSLVTATLNDGISKIRTSQTKLSESKSRFNYLLAKIVELDLRIHDNFRDQSVDFKKKNRDFYENLESKVYNLESDISRVKQQLKIEIQIITDLNVQINKTKGLIALDEHPELREVFHKQLIQFVKNSIVKCNEYRKRHK